MSFSRERAPRLATPNRGALSVFRHSRGLRFTHIRCRFPLMLPRPSAAFSQRVGSPTAALPLPRAPRGEATLSDAMSNSLAFEPLVLHGSILSQLPILTLSLKLALDSRNLFQKSEQFGEKLYFYHGIYIYIFFFSVAIFCYIRT